MAEPILGVGGFITPPKEYFEIAVPIVRDAGGLFIADEVQTGLGPHRREVVGHPAVRAWSPTSSPAPRASANGQPIGADDGEGSDRRRGEGRQHLHLRRQPGQHGGGERDPRRHRGGEAPLQRADAWARRCATASRRCSRSIPGIGDVARHGADAGDRAGQGPRRPRSRTRRATTALLEATRKRGLLIGKGGLYGNALRIAPPMIVSKGQVDDALRILGEGLQEALQR